MCKNEKWMCTLGKILNFEMKYQKNHSVAWRGKWTIFYRMLNVFVTFFIISSSSCQKMRSVQNFHNWQYWNGCCGIWTSYLLDNYILCSFSIYCVLCICSFTLVIITFQYSWKVLINLIPLFGSNSCKYISVSTLLI